MGTKEVEWTHTTALCECGDPHVFDVPDPGEETTKEVSCGREVQVSRDDLRPTEVDLNFGDSEKTIKFMGT